MDGVRLRERGVVGRARERKRECWAVMNNLDKTKAKYTTRTKRIGKGLG